MTMNEQELAQIFAALEATLNPDTTQVERASAHKLCEEVMNSPYSDSIGFALVTKQNAPMHVKHFGLQLIMGHIRQRWGQLSCEAQIQTRNNILTLLEQCSQDELCYVKNGIARSLAEVIKRVWPQRWPSMVPDLLEKAKLGATQVELVQLVFLRIAEDVAVLQNISASHRSQDIRQGLSLVLKDILGFLADVLDKSWSQYQSLKGTPNSLEARQSEIYIHLCKNTLTTYQGYFEWASVENIFMNNGSCIDKLFELMIDENLKVTSAECLILLAQRKGQAVDRQYILGLTSEKYVHVISRVIEQTLVSTSDSETGYIFMKRMAQFLHYLVLQITSQWVAEDENLDKGSIKSLKDFTAFLNLLIDFLKLDDFSLSEYPVLSFKVLLQHRGISKDSVMHSYINILTEITSEKLLKCVSADLPVHAQYDFNDSNEIRLYLVTQKTNLIQVLRGCAIALPNDTVRKILEWVEKEIDCQQSNGWSISGKESLLKWDVLKSIADITIKTGVIYSEKSGNLDIGLIKMGVTVLQKALNCSSPDASISQSLLSLYGAFFPFLKHSNDTNNIVATIIQKVSTMFKKTGQHSRPRAITSTESVYRRHCLSSLIHLCKYFTSRVSPVYETLSKELLEMFKFSSNQERISIFECMIIVSTDWKDYKRQQNLIDEIMAAASCEWITVNAPCMSSVTEFATAIGLLSPSEEMSNTDVSQCRNKIRFTVALTLALVERSQVSEDGQTLQNGGFINPDGNVMNPCGSHVMSAMPFIVALVEYFHSLWSGTLRNTIHKDFANCLDMRDCEKRSLISCNPIVKEPDENEGRTPCQRMQTFIIIVLENCYQIMGKVGKCCSMDIYGDSNLFSCFIKRVFANFSSLPDLRIRSFTRQFLHYFFKHCPERLIQKVLVPIIVGYCGLMNSMLGKNWMSFTTKQQAHLKIYEDSNGNLDDSEDMREADEIIQEQLLRIVSRVYLDLLVNICINKSPKKPQQIDGTGDDVEVNNAIDTEMQDVQDTVQSASNVYQLTVMGKLLSSTECADTLLKTSLKCLSWNDTATVFKGIQLAWPLLKLAFTLPNLDDSVAQSIFEEVLRGLHRHGQHDGCSAQFIALGCYIYVSLRPEHLSLFNILETIPGINQNALKVFDTNYAKLTEKKRKTNFKKLLNVVVDQHVSQKFKTVEVLDKLPPMFSHKKWSPKNGGDDIASLEDLFKPDRVM